MKLTHCFYSNRAKASHFDSTLPLFSSWVPEEHLAWIEKTYCMKNTHLSPVRKLRWMVTTSGSSLLMQNMRQNSVASTEPEVGFMCLETYFKWLHHIMFCPGKLSFWDQLLPYSIHVLLTAAAMFSLASPSSPIWTNPCTLLRYLKIQDTQRVTQSPSCGQSKKMWILFFSHTPPQNNMQWKHTTAAAANNNEAEMQTDNAGRRGGPV